MKFVAEVYLDFKSLFAEIPTPKSKKLQTLNYFRHIRRKGVVRFIGYKAESEEASAWASERNMS